MVLLSPECPIVGILQHVAFSDRPLSLSNVHFGSFRVFYGLLARFRLALSTIPLCGWLHGWTDK